MVLVTFNRHFFEIKAVFGKTRIPNLFKQSLKRKSLLKLTGFENLLKCPLSYPTLLHLVVSSLRRQFDFLWHFYSKTTLTGDKMVVVSQAEMKKGQMNARSSSMWKIFIANLLKRNTLLQLWICSPNNIFQY